jgi:hypothetical protein
MELKQTETVSFPSPLNHHKLHNCALVKRTEKNAEDESSVVDMTADYEM